MGIGGPAYGTRSRWESTASGVRNLFSGTRLGSHVLSPSALQSAPALSWCPVSSDAQGKPRATPPLHLVVPMSHDWTTLGTGGGIETFLKLLFRHAEIWNLRITVPCTGPREGDEGGVHFLPLMRFASNEWAFTRRLRHELLRGRIPVDANSVILANAAQYAWAFRGSGLRVVLMSHAAPPEQLELRHSHLFVRLFQILIEREAVLHASRVVVVNAVTKEYYLSRYEQLRASRLVFIPLGIDLRLFGGRPQGNPWQRLLLPPSTELVLLVGRLYPEKNLELFLSACDILHARDARCHALVIGSGIQEGLIRAALPSRPWLHWIPRIDQYSDVLDIMAVSRLVAITSRYETGPLVLLESIALGTPVVSTDVGRAKELITDQVGRVVRGDPIAFADGMQEVLTWNRLQVKAASSRLSQALDFSTTMDALSTVLRAVLAETPSVSTA